MPELTEQLTQEELDFYQQKADTLSVQPTVNAKVYPVIFITPVTLDRVEAYLKEPKYVVKIRITDKISQLGIASAMDELRELCTIKEDSNPLTYGEGPECDRFKLGLVNFCSENLMKSSINQHKKK